MSRWWFPLALTGVLAAQQPSAPNAPPQSQQAQPEPLPPEEDEASKDQVYTFNPLKSVKQVSVGNYYFKKGKFKAAANRYREATRWNEGNADAWLRLAEADEKEDNSNFKEAREAYAKYLELEPDGKNAKDAKKHLAKMKS